LQSCGCVRAPPFGGRHKKKETPILTQSRGF
jgi:hypothetical protein